MDTGRVVIDTDDLRELVRYTGGAVEQLGDIRIDLVRARGYLEQNPTAYQEYSTVLAGIDGLGSVLTQDRSALIGEVTAIEGEEGMPVPASWTPPTPTPSSSTGMVSSALILAVVLRRIGATTEVGVPPAPTPPPEPWNAGWVTAGGSIPPGSGMSTASVHDEFGVQWSASSSGRYGSASARASADGWVDGEAYAGTTGSGVRAGASGSVGVRASVEAEAEADLGDLKLGASAGASAQAQASGEVHASVGTDGVHAGASGSASASAEGHAGASGSVPGGEASVQVEAEAHAETHGQASVDVGPDGIGGSVGVGASTGASAGYDVAVDGPGGSHVGGGAHVSTGLGIDVNAGGSIGWDEVGFNLDVGAALGIGGGFSLDISISPKDIVSGIAGAVGDLVTDPLGTLEQAGSDVLDAAGSVLDGVDDLLGGAADGAVDGALDGAALDVGSAVSDAVEALPDPGQAAVQAGVEVLPDPGQAAVQAGAEVVSDPMRAWHDAASAAPGPIQAADVVVGAHQDGSMGAPVLPEPPPVPAQDPGPFADRLRQLPAPPGLGDLTPMASEPRLISGINGFFTWPPTGLS